jgi:hypothetical protein
VQLHNPSNFTYPLSNMAGGERNNGECGFAHGEKDSNQKIRLSFLSNIVALLFRIVL